MELGTENIVEITKPDETDGNAKFQLKASWLCSTPITLRWWFEILLSVTDPLTLALAFCKPV